MMSLALLGYINRLTLAKDGKDRINDARRKLKQSIVLEPVLPIIKSSGTMTSQIRF